MSQLPFSERDIERLLEGDVPPGRGDLAELARLFARVRAGTAGEPVPPMNARLLAELDAGQLKGHLRSELERAAERRRVQQGRRRWRVVAAAAAIAVLGGLAIAALRGPLGEDLRTRPGTDDPVSVAEPDGDTPASTAPGDPGGAGTTESDTDGAPIFSPNTDDPNEDLGPGSGSSSGGVVTTEVPDPPDGEASPPETGGTGDPGEVDWGAVADDCGRDYECWIDAAEEPCQEAGPECWAMAADACGDDYGCRYMLAQMCGDTRRCREATFDNPGGHGGDGD